jgi:hypothetical protein
MSNDLMIETFLKMLTIAPFLNRDVWEKYDTLMMLKTLANAVG